ncbi:MAG: VRR-NUC domain-containing protein [Clostridium neonatale]
MAMVYSEKYLEQIFTKEVKKHGGMALKFISPGMSGVPDRVVLMKNGKMAFVELKAPGKKLRLIQEKRKLQLENLGFKVYVIDNIEVIGAVIYEIEKS